MKKNKKAINRRTFINNSLIGGSALLLSCKGNDTDKTTENSINKKSFNLKMVTTWPKDFPGLGTSANRLANKINEASEGQINIKVFGSGELVPAYEAFDAVRNGVADMCHDSPYYWLSKHPATVFFSTFVAVSIEGVSFSAVFNKNCSLSLFSKIPSPVNESFVELIIPGCRVIVLF